jgi:hypothetical protein
MGIQLDMICDPLHTTTLAEILAELRSLTGYTLASEAGLLKDFASDSDDYGILLKALEVLRLTAATISLDKVLEDNRRRFLSSTAARLASEGRTGIDIRVDEDVTQRLSVQ